MDNLPTLLKQRLQGHLKRFSTGALNEAGRQLVQTYQTQHFQLDSKLCLAYLAFRMPATYASLCAVLGRLKELSPPPFKSVLDVGMGPGTLLWAYQNHLSIPERFTGIEQHPDFMEIAKDVLQPFGDSCQLTLNQHTFPDQGLKPHDLVVASYVLNELREHQDMAALEVAWALTQEVLVIVEPGTPKAFKRFLVWRDWLMANGAFLWAPCPHTFACPMASNMPSDWCHVQVRLSRNAALQAMKQGTQNFEDEPYIYLIAGKKPCPTTGWDRVVHTPLSKKGHVRLSLCQQDGTLTEQVLTKTKDPQAYRKARKAAWGDRW